MRILIDGARSSRSAKAHRLASRAASRAAQIVVAPGRSGRGGECAPVDLADQPEHASQVLDALGVALLNRGCIEEGAQLIEQALRIRIKFYGEEHPITALSLNSRARVLRERGDLANAEQTVRTALDINRKAVGPETLPVAVSLYELGVIQLHLGRFADAEASAIEGLGILEKLGIERTDPHVSRLLDVRGRAEAARGDYAAAKATFERLLAFDRAQVGPNHPRYATHLANFASVEESLGLFKKAEADYQKAIDVYANRLRRRSHPNLIDMYANLGSLYLRRNAGPGDLRNAARYFEQALRLDLKVRRPRHLLVANDHANLGRLKYTLGERREALKSFTLALRIYESNLKRRVISSDYPFLAEVLTWIGRLLVERGGADDARRAELPLGRAIGIWTANGAAGTIGKAAAEAALGRALRLQGKDPERARELIKRAYEVLRREFGEDYPYVRTVAEWMRESA